MKKCPWCAEEIQDLAKICRYCGREISSDSKTQKPEMIDVQNNQNEDKTNLISNTKIDSVKYPWYQKLWLKAIFFGIVLGYYYLNNLVDRSIQSGEFFLPGYAEYLTKLGVMVIVALIIIYLIFGSIWRRLFLKIITKKSWVGELALFFEFAFVLVCSFFIQAVLIILLNK